MGRRSAVLVAGMLLLAGVGCSGGDGGGGDDNAFCDNLESLSDGIAGGDLGSGNGIDDLIDIANDLFEAASDDQQDAVTDVGDLLEDADPDDEADNADEIQNALEDDADACEIEDFAVVEVDEDEDEDETTTTTEEEEDETTTTEEVIDEPTGDPNVVSGRVDPAAVGVEADFLTSADLCFRGLMISCDDLFFGDDAEGISPAPDGTVARDYGATCGGRITQFNNDTQRCDENIFAGVAITADDLDDPSFDPLAQQCFGTTDLNGDGAIDGDMAACDALFATTPQGSFEEFYADTCAGRIDADVAFPEAGVTCVDVFGPIAEFG